MNPVQTYSLPLTMADRVSPLLDQGCLCFTAGGQGSEAGITVR